MSDFASILASVDSAAAARADIRPLAPHIRARFGATEARVVQSAREALGVYAAHARRARADLTHTQPDAAALIRAVATAGADARQLHALRRRAARMLHPDRGGDGASLAECNALIDAALRTSRRRT